MKLLGGIVDIYVILAENAEQLTKQYTGVSCLNCQITLTKRFKLLID